jgi:nucleoside-diphosphate-sugar epimerase
MVTGSSGFLGTALVQTAVSAGYAVNTSSRHGVPGSDTAIVNFATGSLDGATDWSAALQGVDVVVHCAGRAHVLNEKSADPLPVFRGVNVDGTLNLARQAAQAKVSRLVFISSIGVNGVCTAPGNAFSESDKPNPHNAYAVSKWEAEQGLAQLAESGAIETVIIRPPLIYGPNAPGNFGALQRAVLRGLPLPLQRVNNLRSLIGIDNLVHFILTCVSDPRAAGETFVVSDNQDISTAELIRLMALAAGRPQRMLPVPIWALRAAGILTGKTASIDRLIGNLQVNCSKAEKALGWTAPHSVETGLHSAFIGMS